MNPNETPKNFKIQAEVKSEAVSIFTEIGLPESAAKSICRSIKNEISTIICADEDDLTAALDSLGITHGSGNSVADRFFAELRTRVGNTVNCIQNADLIDTDEELAEALDNVESIKTYNLTTSNLTPTQSNLTQIVYSAIQKMIKNHMLHKIYIEKTGDARSKSLAEQISRKLKE